MITAFIDANVLFAAALSPRGASHEILRQSVRGNVSLISSKYVIEEAKRNLAAKYPEALPVLFELLEALDLTLINPTKEQVVASAVYTELKDAPVVAAARQAQVDYLVTLDRRHLLNVPEVAQQSGLNIILPGQLLEALQENTR